MNDKDVVIKLMERFLYFTLSSEEVLSAWPQVDEKQSQLMFNCWDAIYDYTVDSDIRAKDPRYEHFTRKHW